MSILADFSSLFMEGLATMPGVALDVPRKSLGSERLAKLAVQFDQRHKSVLTV